MERWRVRASAALNAFRGLTGRQQLLIALAVLIIVSIPFQLHSSTKSHQSTASSGSGAVAAAPPVIHNRRHVTRQDYGARWPLTVDAGYLMCVDDAVTFTSSAGGTYALNGVAIQRSAGTDIRNSTIWASSTGVTGDRKDLGVLIDDGLALCP